MKYVARFLLLINSVGMLVCHSASAANGSLLREHILEPTVTESTLPVVWTTALQTGFEQLAQGTDGKYVLTVGSKLSCFNDSTGALVWQQLPYFYGDTNRHFLDSPKLVTLKNHPWFLLGGSVEDSALSYYNRGVISIRMYPTGEVVRDLFLHRDSTDNVSTGGMGVGSFVVSDDEQFVASATVGGFITVWNISSGAVVLEIPPTHPMTIPLCFTRDSTRLVVITYNSTDIKDERRAISCIDIASQVTVWTVDRDHYGRFQGSLTEDGKHVCYSSQSGITIESFPEFETTIDKQDYFTRGGWFPDGNASHVISRINYPDLTPRGVILYNITDSTELLLDTANAWPFPGTLPGTMYYYCLDQALSTFILKKVAFNWSMNAPEEFRQIAPPSFGPNPCSSQGTMRYHVPGTARVTVAIYSIDGRLEEKVLSDVLQSGEQELQVNCQTLPKGVHVLSISIGERKTAIQIVTLDYNEAERAR
ncbi:MAG: hypothetical protein JSS89_07930 [Bacteroidetes bacterium]|nr:hypothetical protein [Bacteroidota bacterium]